MIGKILSRLGFGVKSAVQGAVGAAGGRKFAFGGFIVPAFILWGHYAHVNELLVVLGVAGILSAVGFEGVADIVSRFFEKK